MNFTEKNGYSNRFDALHAYADQEEQEVINKKFVNQKILDAILDDDSEKFSEIISQSIYDSDPNKEFDLINYRLPCILRNQPPYASLCCFFCAEKCFNTLSMFFSGGTNSEEMKKSDGFSRTPLHFACAGGNLEIIRELQQSDLDINAKDFEGCTPSCYAAMAGNLDVLKFIWMKGAEIIPSKTFYARINPLGAACLYGHLDIVKFIVETIIPNAKVEEEKKSKRSKNSKQKHNQKQYLFSKQYNCGLMPLHLACQGGHADIVNYLISIEDCVDFQVNALDHQQRTPIVCACQNGSLNCVKALIKTGKVDFTLNKKKKLPLIEASSCGHLDIVKFLVNLKEISIQEENAQQLNALNAAILNKHLEIVKCLIENGALLNYDEGKIGEIFMDACRAGDVQIVQILDENCKIPYHSKSGTIVSHWTVENDFILDEHTTWGDKYMQQACFIENIELTSFLLSKNCDFKNVDISSNVKNDWSPFMDFIVKNGADLNNYSVGSAPPIVSTIKAGNLKRVMKMISMGAILNKEIISEYNCVNVACGKGKLDLFKFLMTFKPIISKSDVCLKRCILGYAREQVKNKKKAKQVFYYMAEELLKTQNIDLNDESVSSNTQFPISLAASNCSIDMLQLLGKYGADFTNCTLNFSKMTTSCHLAVYKFLEDRGCKFNKSLSYGFLFSKELNVMKKPALYELLRGCQTKNFDPETLIFLLKYTNELLILEFENNYGNIVDILMKVGSTKAILKTFQKVNTVIYPKNMGLNEFIAWVRASNDHELIDFIKATNHA